ncbi:MAG: ABC transporter substrate-binding protein [Paludibacteraceae bacterium]
MKKLFLIYTLAVITMLTACGRHAAQHAPTDDTPDSTLTVKYAHGFTVDYFADYKRVTINNPWIDNAVLATYYLVKTDTANVPTDGTKIRIPLTHLAVTSCTHYAFLEVIDELHSISGICNPELVYNDTIRQRYADKQIISLGDAFDTNTERLLALKPNALMLASYNQQDNNAKRLAESGIPLIFNNEWTEPNALARAEWLKLVAVFYDKESIAATYFDTIESNYIEAKIAAQLATNQPTVMAGSNFKGTWYMPGGQSYMGQLFADAGANYFYSDDTSNGSLPLNFETVLLHFSQADVWLNAPTATMHELFALDERHQLFKAAKTGCVYGFYARTRNGGANDFWESGVVHPDVILNDLIWALHPTIADYHTPTYICKLAP